MVPAVALIAVGVIPALLKGLYEQFTPHLIALYVASAMLFLVAVISGMSLMVIRDFASRSTKVFRFAPDADSAPEVDRAVRIKGNRDSR